MVESARCACRSSAVISIQRRAPAERGWSPGAAAASCPRLAIAPMQARAKALPQPRDGVITAIRIPGTALARKARAQRPKAPFLTLQNLAGTNDDARGNSVGQGTEHHSHCPGLRGNPGLQQWPAATLGLETGGGERRQAERTG